MRNYFVSPIDHAPVCGRNVTGERDADSESSLKELDPTFSRPFYRKREYWQYPEQRALLTGNRPDDEVL